MRRVDPSYTHSVIVGPLDWLIPLLHRILHSVCPTAQQSIHICPPGIVVGGVMEEVVVVAASVVVVEEDSVVVLDKVVVVAASVVVVDEDNVVVVPGVVVTIVVVVSSSERQHLFLQQPYEHCHSSFQT